MLAEPVLAEPVLAEPVESDPEVPVPEPSVLEPPVLEPSPVLEPPAVDPPVLEPVLVPESASTAPQRPTSSQLPSQQLASSKHHNDASPTGTHASRHPNPSASLSSTPAT